MQQPIPAQLKYLFKEVISLVSACKYTFPSNVVTPHLFACKHAQLLKANTNGRLSWWRLQLLFLLFLLVLLLRLLMLLMLLLLSTLASKYAQLLKDVRLLYIF